MDDQQKPQHAPKEKKKESSDTAPNRQVTRTKSYWLGHDPADDFTQRIQGKGSRPKGSAGTDRVIDRAEADRDAISSTPLLGFDPRSVDPTPAARPAGMPGRAGMHAGGVSIRWVQPKLRITMPGDRHEQEADRVADEVVSRLDAKPRSSANISTTDGPAAAGSNGAGAPAQAAPTAVKPVQVQAKVSAPPSGNSASVGREAPPSVDRALNAPGQALPEETRERMEEAFGEDFGGVRVHTSAAAADSSDDINARAFTVGSHIVFANGEFRPGTAEGERLLAHELAHVVQQGENAGLIQRDGPDIGKELSGDDELPDSIPIDLYFDEDTSTLSLEQKAQLIERRFYENVFGITDEDQLKALKNKSNWKALADNNLTSTLQTGFTFSDGTGREPELLGRWQRARNSVLDREPDQVYADELQVSDAENRLIMDVGKMAELTQLTIQLEKTLDPGYKSFRDPRQSGPPEDFPGQISGESQMRADALQERIRQLKTELTPHDGSPVSQFDLEHQFIEFFEGFARSLALQLLDRNELMIMHEALRYGSINSPDFINMRETLKEVQRIPPTSPPKSDPLGISRQDNNKGMSVEQFYRIRAEQLRRENLEEFPILNDPELSIFTLANSDPMVAQKAIRDLIKARMSSISSTRESLLTSRDDIWDYPNVVGIAMKVLGINEGIGPSELIQRELKTTKDMGDSIDIFLGILSLIPGPGWIVRLVAAGASIYGLIRNYQDYTQQHDAYRTAFDRKNALGNEDPDSTALIINAIMTIPDVIELGKVMKEIANATTGAAPKIGSAVTTLKTFTSSDGVVKDIVRNIDEPLKKLDAIAQPTKADWKTFENEVRTIANRAADELGIIKKKRLYVENFISISKSYAKETRIFNEKVKAGLLRLRTRKGMAGTIWGQIPSIDGNTIGRLLQFDDNLITSILRSLSSLGGGIQQSVIYRLVTLADTSEHFAKGFQLLFDGLADRGGAFEALFSYFMLKSGTRNTWLIELISRSGMSSDEIRIIVDDVMTKKGLTSLNQNAVADHLLPELTDRIMSRIGNNMPYQEGFGRIVRESSRSRRQRLFMKWTKDHADEISASADELSSKTITYQSVDYLVLFKKVSDVEAVTSIIMDYQDLLEDEEFTPYDKKTLQTYRALVLSGYKGEDGIMFTEVHYIFSTRAAAAKHKSLIVGALGTKAKIMYIDEKGKMAALR